MYCTSIILYFITNYIFLHCLFSFVIQTERRAFSFHMNGNFDKFIVIFWFSFLHKDYIFSWLSDCRVKSTVLGMLSVLLTAWMYAWLYVCVWLYACVCLPFCLPVCMCDCLSACLYVCSCMSVCLPVCVSACLYVCDCLCVCLPVEISVNYHRL